MPFLETKQRGGFMREFLLDGEKMIDHDMVSFLKGKGERFFFPCKWIRYNDRKKLFFFNEGFYSLGSVRKAYTLDEICEVIKRFLSVVKELEKYPEIAKENVIWDLDSIYVDEKKNIRLIYLPVYREKDGDTDNIYKKRVYALIEGLLKGTESAGEMSKNSEKDINDGELLRRRVVFQEVKSFGNWDEVLETMNRNILQDDSMIILQTKNENGEVFSYTISDEEVMIGSDPGKCQIPVEKQDDDNKKTEAKIGWNGINFYIYDFETESGTFVNNTRIASEVQVPIGRGSSLRIGGTEFLII